ncbi:unnamed protein product [Ixodes pacificus]
MQLPYYAVAMIFWILTVCTLANAGREPPVPGAAQAEAENNAAAAASPSGRSLVVKGDNLQCYQCFDYWRPGCCRVLIQRPLPPPPPPRQCKVCPLWVPGCCGQGPRAPWPPAKY